MKELGVNEINRIEFLVDCCMGYLLVKGSPNFEKIDEVKELLYNDVEEMIVNRIEAQAIKENAEIEYLKEDLADARRQLGQQQEEIEILKHENEQFNNKESVPAETLVMPKIADNEKTFIIYTDEGNLALSQEGILNTIDADLDMMDNEEEMTWTVLRKDMTEEEINNLPVI